VTIILIQPAFCNRAGSIYIHARQELAEELAEEHAEELAAEN
jgi:hypothetical protein